MTNKEAIANLNRLYGMVAPDIQRSLDVAIKALERPQGEWICTFHSTFPQYASDEYRCSICNGIGGKVDKFCKHCGADMREGDI